MSSRRFPALGIATAVLIGLGTGAAITYLVLRKPASPAGAASTTTAASQSPSAPVSISLTPEAVARAHVQLGRVASAADASEIRIPATIEPNAYRQAAVTALVSGRITGVTAALGQRVRRGDLMAAIYSPDLSEAERAYLSAKAELQAHEERLARVADLVERGVASRQELEEAHAEHTSLTTAAEGARSRLELLGVSADQIDRLSSVSQMTATAEVRAPIDAVVTARQANVGVNVQSGTPLFTLVDLSTVWVVGDLYEKDFERVRSGNPVTIAVAAYPEMQVHGTITYIDPQLNTETRTAKVRVEIGNPRGDLRLGMYAQMLIGGGAAAPIMVVPKSAIQTVGDKPVVYVADPGTPGRFTERPIEIGRETGTNVEVIAGVQPGDTIVTEGSFFIRAERERLGVPR